MFRYEHIEKNPNPARGDGILTLDQLRYYIRAFKRDPRYGIAGLPHGFAAFVRFCGLDLKWQLKAKILPDTAYSNWLPARVQRRLSSKVRQVLKGQVIFVPASRQHSTWKAVFDSPVPPVPGDIPHRDHEFLLERTVVGPKVRRFPAGF